MNKRIRAGGAIMAAAVGLGIAGLAAPAAAGGNSISADQGVRPQGGANRPCTLGQVDCAGYAFSSSSPLFSYQNKTLVANPDYFPPPDKNDPNYIPEDDPYNDPNFDPGEPFILSDDETTYRFHESSSFYVYKEGVVSFGAPLPLDASLAGGTASFGTGNWFAPALGAATDVLVFYDGQTESYYDPNSGPFTIKCVECEFQYRISWGAGITTGLPLPPLVDGVDFDSRDPCPTDDNFYQPTCPNYQERRQVFYPDPQFQLLIQGNLEDYGFTGVVFEYKNGLESSDRQSAYNYRPFDFDPRLHDAEFYQPNNSPERVYFIGDAASDNIFGPPGVPEPSSWLLLLLGFGGLGAALRQRRAARTTAA